MVDNPQHNASYLPDDPEQPTNHPLSPLDEPPIDEGDTRPKAPVVMPEPGAVASGGGYPPVDAQAASLLADPSDWAAGRAPTYPGEPADPPRGRPLLLITVMVGMVCLCVSMIGLASFAGYRDGLATNDARVTQTLATGIA